MKTQVLPNNLKDALKWIKPGRARKTFLPVLENVLIEATWQGVRLTATDLELSASVFIGGKTEKPGKTTVRFNALETLAKNLPDAPLAMETKKNGHLALAQDSRTILLDTIDAQEFPLTPTAKSKTYTALDSLLDACRFVQHALCTEDNRPSLTYAQVKKGKMWASDGFRLAIAPAFNAEASLPRSLVNFLARMKEQPSKLTLNDKLITAWFGDNWVSGQQHEGTFPVWEEVIPKELNWSIKVDSAEFLDKVQLIASLKPDSNMLRLQPKRGRLYLEATSEHAAITDWLPASCQGKGDLFALNIRYLMDTLLGRKPFIKEGWLQLKGRGMSSPVMFFDQHTRLVEAVMPMHISK